MPHFDTLGSEHIYTGRAFGVRRVLVRLPDGKEKYYDLVDHARAITLVPVDDLGNIYFVRQFRIGSNSDLLELPAGLVEPGENPDDTAGREIREEIGMAAAHLLKLGEVFLAPGYSTEFLAIYLATGLYPAPLQADADEFLQVEAIPVSQAMLMAESGAIQDAKTLAALFLARPHLHF
jgi:ADP-ribose pyrophosphatase